MEYTRDRKSSRKNNECKQAQPLVSCVNHCLPGQGQGQWQAVPIAEPCPVTNQGQAMGQWNAIAVSEPCSCIPLPATVQPCHPCVYNIGPPTCPQPDVNKMYSCRKVCCVVENIPCPTTSTDEEPKPEMIMEFAQTDISFDPNMSMSDKSMQWPEEPKLREINIKEFEVETREIRHRTGKREFEVVHRTANTKVPEDGGEPVTEYQKVVEKKSPEEMELLNAQLPRSSKTILKNESQVKSLSKLVSLHEDMLQDKSETSIEEEVLLPTNLHPEENEPFAKRRKFGKLENEDDESVPPQFRAASVRKHRHITETEMEIAMEDDEEDQEKIRTSNEEQMEKSQKHRRSASLTEDGQKNSMPRTSSLASPTETEKTRPRSSRASHTEDARNSSTRRKSSLASPRNTTASAVTMKRTSARDSSSKNKRDPDDDVLQSEVNLNALRNYEMAREVQDIEISRAGSAVSSQVIPKDEQSKANESSHRVSLKEYSDDNVPTEDNEQQETNKNDYRSASQIVSHYSDNDKDDDENAVPNDEDAEAASALYIRRHYTKETKSKQPGDLVTKKNIISESTSEHRVTRYPPDKPEPEIEPEPEPQPSPKPRKRRVAKKPAKSKYPSKDIVPRCVREPRCCYVGTVRAHPCRSCPHCTCTYATTRCPAYPCYEMPCCEMPRCSRFGFGGQYIYSPSHRQ